MTPAIGASWTAGVPPACTGFGAGEHRGWRSRGYLPHLDAANLVQHIVFRLADSLPSGIRAKIAKIPADDRVLAIDRAFFGGHGRRTIDREQAIIRGDLCRKSTRLNPSHLKISYAVF